MSSKTYFIQDTRGYTGNSVVWWAKDAHGYTSNQDDAWEVSEEQARRIERNRDSDKAWPADIVRAAVTPHVDIQRLPRDMRRLTDAS